MQDQNSQFNNPYFDYTREGEQIPDYAYTKKQRRQERRLRRKRRGKSFFGALLCVLLSFVAGFSGAMGALYIAHQYYIEQNEKITNENLFCEDPESVITRPDPAPSIYGSAGEDAFAVSGVVHKVQDAVVVINVTISGSSIWGNPTTSTSAGSGVIISADGYILTCNHVVEGATSIMVTLRNKKVYEAALVGSDDASDLAVLKISADEALTFVEQGHSADLVAGEQVVAIGNPLGLLGGSVTIGYISATERVVQVEEGVVMTLIQTDAAINSGNSGGGLFNLAGELIGIVNSKYSASGVEGLAFAIPIDSAYPVQLDLMQYGYVRGVIDHGLALFEVTRDYLPIYYNRYGIEKVGVYVTESEYATELKILDRIVSVNGIEIKTTTEIKDIFSKCKVGDTVKIVAERKVADDQVTTITCDLVLQEYVPDRIKDLLQ